MPQIQNNSLIARIQSSQLKFKNATIVPHKKLTATTCPGQYFPWEDIITTFKHIHLSFGSKNEKVKKAQLVLNQKGFNCGVADGIFGAKTKTAVMNYQKANGLPIDGVINDIVWKKLNCNC